MPTDEEIAPDSEPKPKPKRKKAKPSGEAKTPDEWCAQLGHIKMMRRAGKRVAVASWQHNAAKNLHRWQQHAHHAGAPIQLTQKDYEAALAAAAASPLVPHRGALGKY